MAMEPSTLANPSLQTPPPPETPKIPSSKPNLVHRLYKTRDLTDDPHLAAVLTTFVNTGFKSHDAYPASRWSHEGDRFTSPTEILEMLGPDGTFCVVYNVGGRSDVDDAHVDEPVACTGLKRWTGDLFGNDTDAPGYELKTAVTKTGWTKMGLVGRCIDVLVRDLARRRREAGPDAVDGEIVKLWSQTAEEVNGEYWRRRGYVEHRRFALPVGAWGSYYGFVVSILVKEVSLVGLE